MARRRNKRFSEQLRQAILSADMTQYRLAKESGVPKETIWRFVHGRVGLSLPSIDAIVEALGLSLGGRKEKRRRRTT